MLKAGGRGPITSGFRKTLRRTKAPHRIHEKWSAKCSSSLRSAATNGQWTQARLHRAKMVESNLCKLCGAAPGTPIHRHNCATTAEARGQCIADAKCDCFVSALYPSARHLLTTTFFPAKVDLSEHLPSVEATLEWELRQPGGVIAATDTVYTDGFMIDGPSKVTGRVGYGFIAYSEDGVITAKAFGVPPRWIDSVPGAEAWALAEALRCSMPGVTIWSDCLSVVKRLKAGRAAATASSVKLARLWRTIFD